MLNQKKLDTKLLTELASAEVLVTAVRLYRISNLRILHLNGYKTSNGAITIPSADRPSVTLSFPVYRTDSNSRSTAVGMMVVSPEGGVARYYGSVYNGSGTGSSVVGANDQVYGIAVWSV